MPKNKKKDPKVNLSPIGKTIHLEGNVQSDTYEMND